MSRPFPARRTPLWAAACLSALGCGPAAGTGLPVAGRVLVDGRPLAAGSVLFHPDAPAGPEPRAAVGPGGAYALTAAPGRYRVTVVAAAADDPGDPARPFRWLVPRRYTNPNLSGLAVEVRPDPPPGAYDLSLSGR